MLVILHKYSRTQDSKQSHSHGGIKKMTQHVKCDYSVTPENFCAKFCTVVKEGAVH